MQNKIVIEHQFKNTRQKMIYEALNKEGIDLGLSYLSSLKGKLHRNRNIVIDIKRKFKCKTIDPLEHKRGNYWSKSFKKLFDTTDSHSPLNVKLGNWIGVEIECFIPFTSFPNIELNEQECRCECQGHQCSWNEDAERHEHGPNEDDECYDCCCAYCCEGCQDCDSTNERDFRKALGKLIEKQKIRRVSVKQDGSITPDEGCFAVELAILFTKDNRQNLFDLCKLLGTLEAKVNKTCGLHVHLDQRGSMTDMELIGRRAHNLGQCLPFLASLVPKSRLKNQYCQLSVSKPGSDDRYHAINMTALHKYNTIEIRLHSSTTDFIKINNWIDILLMITSHPERLPKSFKTLNTFCEHFPISNELKAYCKERIAKFDHKNIDFEENDHVLDSMIYGSRFQSLVIDEGNTNLTVDMLRRAHETMQRQDPVPFDPTIFGLSRVQVSTEETSLPTLRMILGNDEIGRVFLDGSIMLGSIRRQTHNLSITSLYLTDGIVWHFSYTNFEQLRHAIDQRLAIIASNERTA